MTEQKFSAYQVLRNRFPANEYVLIEEVSDASGFSRSRSLDFMLINLWGSRGLAVTGIERKSNRGDWLKELRTPAKQENHFKYCDYFFLLTDKEGVAKIEEIPANWGWYHINEKGVLKTLKTAPKLKSIPIQRSLLCAMLRRAAAKEKYIHIDSIEERIEAAREQAKTARDNDNRYKLQRADENEKLIKEFEEASGLVFGSWGAHDPKKVGAAVKLICNNEITKMQDQLEGLKKTATIVLDRITKAFNEISDETSTDTAQPTAQAN